MTDNEILTETEKVLVCITAQENSLRLISEGFEIAKQLDAPFHILHIKKGNTIFDGPESGKLLDNLFKYGTKLGGEIHFLCSESISDTITDFIKTNAITHLVIGESPANVISCSPTIFDKLKSHSSLCLTVVPREQLVRKEA